MRSYSVTRTAVSSSKYVCSPFLTLVPATRQGEGNGVLVSRRVEIGAMHFDDFVSTAPVCGKFHVDLLIDTLARSSPAHLVSMSVKADGMRSVHLEFSGDTVAEVGIFELDFAEMRGLADLTVPTSTSIAMPNENWTRMFDGKSMIYDVVQICIEPEKVTFVYSSDKCRGKVEFGVGGAVSVVTNQGYVSKEVDLDSMQDLASILDLAQSPVQLFLPGGNSGVPLSPRFSFMSCVGVVYSLWFH